MDKRQRYCWLDLLSTLTLTPTADMSVIVVFMLSCVQWNLFPLILVDACCMLDAFHGVSIENVYLRLLGARMVMAYATKLWTTPPNFGRPLRTLKARCRRQRLRDLTDFICGFIRGTIAATCYTVLYVQFARRIGNAINDGIPKAVQLAITHVPTTYRIFCDPINATSVVLRRTYRTVYRLIIDVVLAFEFGSYYQWELCNRINSAVDCIVAIADRICNTANVIVDCLILRIR